MESKNMQPADIDLTGEFSVFSPSLQQTAMSSGAEQQMMQIYLRVRPFSKEELSANEDQDCVVIDDGQTVTLNAPKGSATRKSSEKGIGLSIHKFSFSKVFGPQTTQGELFEDAVRSQVFDFLEGENALIFSYGVTNAGKTFTIQGTPKHPGILPRVLDAVFSYIGGLQYHGMDLKPYLMNGAQFLDPDQVKQERTAKMTVLASVKEECDHQRLSGSSEPSIFSDITLSSSSSSNNLAEAGGDQFALWVAFFEIYNECVYDLLQPSQSKKRSPLRVCDDGAGNAYVKDLKWINIQNLSEANKLLQFGNKNRSAAATKINQSSSRSHSIFTMKLLKIDRQTVERISEFSLCDLAGSERCNKAKTFGERLKEAGNINNSLLILGKCISALRSSQADRTKVAYIPFRESKLTKLFQAFFCGKGRAAMIVNINQCASTYDETLHIMKFSAVAKQVVQVIPDKPAESSVPCLVGRDGKPLMKNGVLEGYPSEDELFEEEDEADMSLLPQNDKDLLNIIENLRTKFLAERRKNLVQEMEIRKEMGDAMLQQLLESEELRIREAEELKESYAEKLENTFEMYKDAIKDHAYQSAMSNLEDNYVPLDAFTAEQEKAEALRCKVSELEDLLSSIQRGVSPVLRVDQWSQTEPLPDAGEMDDRIKRLCQENSALEKMCEDNKQLILYLEKRLVDLNQTLQHVQDDFLEKSDDVEALRKTVDEQSKSMGEILCQNAEKDKEIASLKAEIEKLSQKSPVQLKTKTRRGLLANIKEVVSSPRRGPSSNSLVKPPRTPKY
ncbi:kinesin-like protein KIF20A [Poecilia reticulata]|uniref:kinesin-like protein KIF20A n=1 Tax=Poecilia reticulata TaxID=8081 RepID=UPI0004A36E3D|nr:PREDICTED: kinesin-like protein KIF20A [Poecilia reticulata]